VPSHGPICDMSRGPSVGSRARIGRQRTDVTLARLAQKYPAKGPYPARGGWGRAHNTLFCKALCQRHRERECGSLRGISNTTMRTSPAHGVGGCVAAGEDIIGIRSSGLYFFKDRIPRWSGAFRVLVGYCCHALCATFNGVEATPNMIIWDGAAAFAAFNSPRWTSCRRVAPGNARGFGA
jgi:hypothetical protein